MDKKNILEVILYYITLPAMGVWTIRAIFFLKNKKELKGLNGFTAIGAMPLFDKVVFFAMIASGLILLIFGVFI